MIIFMTMRMRMIIRRRTTKMMIMIMMISTGKRTTAFRTDTF